MSLVHPALHHTYSAPRQHHNNILDKEDAEAFEIIRHVYSKNWQIDLQINMTFACYCKLNVFILIK
jgi:hypothetical protein